MVYKPNIVEYVVTDDENSFGQDDFFYEDYATDTKAMQVARNYARESIEADEFSLLYICEVEKYRDGSLAVGAVCEVISREV